MDSRLLKKGLKRKVLSSAAGLELDKGGTTIGGETNNNHGVIANGQIGFGLSKSTMLIFDLAFHPFEVKNPVKAEAFSSLYALASIHFGKPLYMRLGLGAAFRWWSGEDVWVSSEVSPAIGVSSGYEFRVKKGFTLAPEMIWRGSVGNEIIASLVGIQIVGAWL